MGSCDKSVNNSSLHSSLPSYLGKGEITGDDDLFNPLTPERSSGKLPVSTSSNKESRKVLNGEKNYCLSKSKEYDEIQYSSENRMPSRMSQYFVQYWVNTGCLPILDQECIDNTEKSDTSYSLSEGLPDTMISPLAKITTSHKSNGKPQQSFNDSPLKSSSCSVDTTAYILSNTNITAKKETTNIVGGINRCNIIPTKKKCQRKIEFKHLGSNGNLNVNKQNVENSKCHNEQEQRVITDEKSCKEIVKETDDTAGSYVDRIRGSADKEVKELFKNCIPEEKDNSCLSSQDKHEQSNNKKWSDESTRLSQNNVKPSLRDNCSNPLNRLSQQKKLYTGRDSPIDLTTVVTSAKNIAYQKKKNYCHPALSPTWLNAETLDKNPSKEMRRKRKRTTLFRKTVAENYVANVSNCTNDCMDVEDLQLKRNTISVEEENNSTQTTAQTNVTSVNGRIQLSYLALKEQIKHFPLSKLALEKEKVERNVKYNLRNKISPHQNQLRELTVRLERLPQNLLNYHLKKDEPSSKTIETAENRDTNVLDNIDISSEDTVVIPGNVIVVTSGESDVSTILLYNRNDVSSLESDDTNVSLPGIPVKFCSNPTDLNHKNSRVSSLIRDMEHNNNEFKVKLLKNLRKSNCKEALLPVILLKRLTTAEIEKYQKKRNFDISSSKSSVKSVKTNAAVERTKNLPSNVSNKPAKSSQDDNRLKSSKKQSPNKTEHISSTETGDEKSDAVNKNENISRIRTLLLDAIYSDDENDFISNIIQECNVRSEKKISEKHSTSNTFSTIHKSEDMTEFGDTKETENSAIARSRRRAEEKFDRLLRNNLSQSKIGVNPSSSWTAPKIYSVSSYGNYELEDDAEDNCTEHKKKKTKSDLFFCTRVCSESETSEEEQENSQSVKNRLSDNNKSIVHSSSSSSISSYSDIVIHSNLKMTKRQKMAPEYLSERVTRAKRAALKNREEKRTTSERDQDTTVDSNKRRKKKVISSDLDSDKLTEKETTPKYLSSNREEKSSNSENKRKDSSNTTASRIRSLLNSIIDNSSDIFDTSSDIFNSNKSRDCDNLNSFGRKETSFSSGQDTGATSRTNDNQRKFVYLTRSVKNAERGKRSNVSNKSSAKVSNLESKSGRQFANRDTSGWNKTSVFCTGMSDSSG